ncbi:MAPEG family protein, partial [Aeromonas veronii]|nr:MAPEG family protein [Aeromonas veronii]
MEWVGLETSLDTTPWLLGSFTAARVVHTVAYLLGWQPWRTLAYGVGVVCLFGMGTVGASLLAKIVNGNAGLLDSHSVLRIFASKLAPTYGCGCLLGLGLHLTDNHRRHNQSCAQHRNRREAFPGDPPHHPSPHRLTGINQRGSGRRDT